VLAGSVLYAGTDEGLIYAFEGANGDQVWQRAVCAAVTPPAVHGDRLYVGDADGRLNVLATENGARLWNRYAGASAMRRPSTVRPVTTAPVVDGDQIYVACKERGLYCYAPGGERLWTYGIAGVDGSTPVAVQGLVFAGSESGRVSVVTREHGTRTMKIRLPAPILAPVAVTARLVFAVCADGGLYAVERAGDNPVSWSKDAGVPSGTGPVFDRGLVYVGTADGRLLGFAADSGAEQVSLPVGGPVTATPVVRDTTAYVVAGDSLTALDLSPGADRLSTTAVRWTKNAGAAICGPPAIGSTFAYIALSTGHIATVDLVTGDWPG
jgi:outer membrane protein assembly factor BamB